jgi:hypothetical protein
MILSNYLDLTAHMVVIGVSSGGIPESISEKDAKDRISMI